MRTTLVGMHAVLISIEFACTVLHSTLTRLHGGHLVTREWTGLWGLQGGERVWTPWSKHFGPWRFVLKGSAPQRG